MVGRSGFLLGARKVYFQVRFAVCFRDGNLYGRFLSHRIHVGNHYLYLVELYGKCRDSYHTWILWVSKADGRFKSAWFDSSRSSSSHWPPVPRNYHSRKSHSFPYVFFICKGKIMEKLLLRKRQFVGQDNYAKIKIKWFQKISFKSAEKKKLCFFPYFPAPPFFSGTPFRKPGRDWWDLWVKWWYQDRKFQIPLASWQVDPERFSMRCLFLLMKNMIVDPEIGWKCVDPENFGMQ